MHSAMFQGLEEVEMAAALTRRNITYFPVVPGRVEFAVEVRQWLIETRPDVLAIELPYSLRSHYMRAIARFPEISIIKLRDPVDSSQWVYIPVEPTDPFVEALRTAQELGIPIEFLEPNWGDRPHVGDAYPDTYVVQMIGRERYINSYRLQESEPTDDMLEYAAAMARKLQGTSPDREVAAVISLNVLDLILDAMEIPQEHPIKRRGSAHLAELCHAHPDCLAEITVEFPFLIDRYNRYRADLSTEPQFLDRMTTQLAVLETAEIGFRRAGEGQLDAWEYGQITKFARNLAHSSGELAADVVDLTLAARGVAGDNYTAHVWHALNLYPAQSAVSDLPVIRVAGEEIWCRRRRIRLHRTLPMKLLEAKQNTLVMILDEDCGGLNDPLKTSEPQCAHYWNAESDCGGLVAIGNPLEPLSDLWSDARFDAAETNAERLLLAALVHSTSRTVVHIAAKPPRRVMRQIAAHLNRKIEHVPIGQVSRAKLECFQRSASGSGMPTV